MEKLDKETLTKEYLDWYDKPEENPWLKHAYIAGLEYAENHYLKLIEEKDKELQTTKELLKESKDLGLDIIKRFGLIGSTANNIRENNSKIGEFLKQ